MRKSIYILINNRPKQIDFKDTLYDHALNLYLSAYLIRCLR